MACLVNVCHASAAQKMCLIFFVIIGVITKNEQFDLHQEMKCS